MNETLILSLLLLLSGVYLAWSIGANDVANAMGTSVGSGALTLKQAIVIAALLEFTGAFLFGSHVTETVQKGIINTEIFSQIPIDFVLGMLAALIASGLWIQIATFFGLPVSTTHSIVGGIVGFGLISGGVDAVLWENVFLIGTSWLISPVAGAIFGFIIFSFLRSQILYRTHPLKETKKWLPWILFFVGFILSSFFFFGGIKYFTVETAPLEALFCTFVFSGGAALIGKVAVNKIVLPEEKKEELFAPEMFRTLSKARKELDELSGKCPPSLDTDVKSLKREMEKIQDRLSHPELYETSSQEFKVIERIFGRLQIISASLMAFSHGANDVANAIGPLSAALFVLETHSLAIPTEVPVWMLAIGGAGIVVGLATWGWRVIATIGKKLTELTPTRGFAAEFSAALTILIASRLGMPISTTHTLVGAVIGVGLARGIGSLNLATMRDILLSWVITIPAGAAISCGLFFLLKTLFSYTAVS